MSSRGEGVEVTLYGREGCHLCEEARLALERVRDEAPFRLVEIDIDTDDALHRAYFERIPVVLVGGEELFEFFVDEDRLKMALEAAAQGHRRARTI